MTDETDREDDIALAAEYALGLLTPAEEKAFEARLAVDPEFRAEYAHWAGDLVAITDDIPDVLPSNSVKAGIDARLFGIEKRSFLQRIGLIPVLMGGLAAAALLFAVVNTGVLTAPDAPTYQAEIAGPDANLLVLASFDPAAGTLRVERATGSAPAGRVLELWLIAGEAAPVSLGVLPEGQVSEMELSPELAAALDGGLLAISDEPPGGSPTGAPTGDVLATGEVVTL